MEVFVIGVTVFLSLMVFKLKFEAKRWADLILDVFVFALLIWLFHGSEVGMVVATIASMCTSLYLYIKPPVLPDGINLDSMTESITNITSSVETRFDSKEPQDVADQSVYGRRLF